MVKSTVLVFGGSGMLGKSIENVLQYDTFSSLSKEDDFVFLSSKDCDLCSIEQSRQIFEVYKPRYVINCAAIVGGLYFNNNKFYNPLIFERNTLMNINLFQLCDEFRVEKCMLILSTCVFPDKTTYPLQSQNIHKGEPHDSNYGYSYAKRMIEVMARAYNKAYIEKRSTHSSYDGNLVNRNYDTQYICLSPTNLYGKHDNFNLHNAHVIPALMHKAYISKQKDIPLHVWGAGECERQFLYVDDLAKIVLYSMNHLKLSSERPHIHFIVSPPSSTHTTTIKDVVTLIQELSELDSDKVAFDHSFDQGQIRKTTSDNEYKSICNEFNMPEIKFTNIACGLRSTWKWLIENYSEIRK